MGCTSSVPVESTQEQEASRPILAGHRQEQQSQKQQQTPQQQQQQQQKKQPQDPTRKDPPAKEAVVANAHSGSAAAAASNRSGANASSANTADGDASVSSVAATSPSPPEVASTKKATALKKKESNGSSANSSSHSIPPPPPALPPPGPAPPPKEKEDGSAADPHWERLFRALSPRLLDPEDLPSALDAAISGTVDKLSPVEVSFVRRRVKAAARAAMASEGSDPNGSSGGGVMGGSLVAGLVSSGGGGGDGGGGGSKRSSLTKKVGRLVGKASAAAGGASDKSSGNEGSGHPPSSHPALEEGTDRTRTTKAVYQKERLIDLPTMRRTFEGGERGLRALRSGAAARSEASEAGGSGKAGATAGGERRRSLTGKAPPPAALGGEDPPVKTAERSDGEALERIDVYGAAFLLLLYLSEVRWDHVAEVAKRSAKGAGLVTDVNKLALRDGGGDDDDNGEKGTPKRRRSKPKLGTPPRPPKASSSSELPPPPAPPSCVPPSETYGDPDLAAPEPEGGVRLSSVCFLIASALRGSRRQRLALLFHLLLPRRELNEVLASHPGGGLPAWLLEVDGDGTVMSYDSLSFYYHYEGVMVPPSFEGGNRASFKGARHKDQKKLCIDAKSSVEVLATLLADSMSAGSEEGREDHKVGMQRLSSILLEEDLDNRDSDRSSPSDEGNSLSSVKCQEVTDALAQASRDGGTSSSVPSARVEKFVELSSALAENSFLSNDFVRLSWSMVEFMDWADEAIDDVVLDAVMRRLFGAGVLPSAEMERRLVAQRWIDWDLRRSSADGGRPAGGAAVSSDAGEGGPPTPSRPAGGFKKMFSTHEPATQPPEEPPPCEGDFNRPWGGIGGADGKGGLGFGVLHCVDRQWWDEWSNYSGWDAGSGSGTNGRRSTSSSLSLKRPNELSTERLVDRSPDAPYVSGSRGSYELMRRDVHRDRDYVLVPPGVWNVLYELYGGGPALPRMVLPPDGDGDTDNAPLNGGAGLGSVSMGEGEVEIIRPKSPMGLDSSDGRDRYPREIPASVNVATHPWVLHCQLCDPGQPYRRGDAGPMSIRIMATPDQPLWRLFAEIVVRLPIGFSRARDSKGEGRARLWRFDIPPNNGKTPGIPPGGRYGPWALLCRNRHAEIPIVPPAYDKFEEKWKAYADEHSVESIGLVDNMRLMFEFAVAGKDGLWTWPRGAAAKATNARRIAEEDAAFRMMLRGLDADGNPSKAPVVKRHVDAMDSSGRWYQAIVVNVDSNVPKGSDRENISAEGSGADDTAANDSKSNGPVFRENTLVRVHFNDHTENHQEWIDVKSDRLAARGRMTASSSRNLDLEQDGDDASQSTEKEGPKSRIAAGINKKKSSDGNNGGETTEPGVSAVCLFPGYGACGLMNLGNTCYANSGWQCMSYLPLLRAYLLSGQFRAYGDINRDNPLGTGGKILEEFAELLRFMWSGRYGARAPQKFRTFLAKCRGQYSGADQQDAQELLNDMFDMLHEDGNRVRKKPYVEALEDKFIEGAELSVVGREAWRRFLRRNRSAISDLSMGQVYNRVTCPVCNHSSKNFDPFNMLSLPFPTVAEVIFRCMLVRRANALNCPGTLALIGRHHPHKDRPPKPPSSGHPSPPSKDLICEEYLIPMSRLADIGDLRMKLSNLSGVPARDLRVCKREDIESGPADTDDSSFSATYTKVSALPDKEGPCVKLLHQESLDDVSSPTIANIVAFESTLVVRPVEVPTTARKSDTSKADPADDASTTADEMSDDSSGQAAGARAAAARQAKADEGVAREYLKVYGDEKECVVYDTNPTPLAKVISRSLWPKSTEDFTLGLRVDAIDHRNHWFPGSVIEIVVDSNDEDQQDEGEAAGSDGLPPQPPSPPQTKVKIHFDNFSAKWDEVYSIDQFRRGRVCPLYSHAAPRPRPTEFIVHHRSADKASGGRPYLFGQSFYLQCHNEWSTARAGAHILAQASRFLESPHSKMSANGKKIDPVERKITHKERHEARRVISRVIEALIKSDKKYVESAIHSSKGAPKDGDDRPPFDVSVMSQILSKKLGEVLPLLPFDVRVTTANSPLGTSNEEAPFPFSLVRTIGNYMNVRHSIVLHWRDRPDGAVSNGSRSPGRKHTESLSPRRSLYSPPLLVAHKQSSALLDEHQKEEDGGDSSHNALRRHPSSTHGGLHIGVCLNEFCKEQQLDATGCWRCPSCKMEREGKQSMTLWNLPDLLTFHLKRFNASSRWREKITTRVDFPLTGLDMREWCDPESPPCRDMDDEACVYDLVGVVNHYGGMTGGHYVATCRATACGPDGDEDAAYNFSGAGLAGGADAAAEELNGGSGGGGWKAALGRSKDKEAPTGAAARAVAMSSEPLWLQFDDDLVEPLPPRNVVSETAYVLFYRRRRMRSANVAKYGVLE